MITQCPDCQTTFRVTAEALQQADGRVRCGGCGNAFNALENMSGDDASEASDQSKQLLDTLDKLAGPEVDIEDTGTEWRVLEQSDDQDAEGKATETTPVHGRESDLPRQVPDEQESFDLPESESQKKKSGERRYDDNTVLPDDFDDEDDLDELPFLEPEPPKRRADDREEALDTPEFTDSQADLALGEPGEWMDLLAEVGDEEPEAEVTAEASAEEEPELAEEEPQGAEEEAADGEPPGEEMPSDINTQFLLQAEEMGLDTGGYPVLEVEDDEDDDEPAREDEESEAADLVETDIADAGAEEEKEAAGEEYDHTEISLEEMEALSELDIEKALTASDSKDEAATEESSEADDEIAAPDEDIKKPFSEESPMVEAIVMEGELIGDSTNQKQLVDTAAAGQLQDIGKLQDTYSLNRGTVRDGRIAKLAGNAIAPIVVVLALLLIVQIVHQSRQSLATYSAFNNTIGTIYRALGNPVTPEWDIRGWRFEATNGKVDEKEDLLTIYSRIANKSNQALPYPLLHISLTDRWEDVIGSRALDPNEYLAGDLDSRKPVPSGENFTAVITIESPSVDATGFRLTACYRISPGRVRCADEHFKN